MDKMTHSTIIVTTAAKTRMIDTIERMRCTLSPMKMIAEGVTIAGYMLVFDGSG